MLGLGLEPGVELELGLGLGLEPGVGLHSSFLSSLTLRLPGGWAAASHRECTQVPLHRTALGRCASGDTRLLVPAPTVALKRP